MRFIKTKKKLKIEIDLKKLIDSLPSTIEGVIELLKVNGDILYQCIIDA